MDRYIDFQNELDEVVRVAAFIEELGEELELRPALVNSLQLALEEAVVNVINYAYADGVKGEARLSVTADNNRITFTLTDSGYPFDPTAKVDPDLTASVEDRPVGGLGILLIKKMMDEVTYHYTDGKNMLVMSKSL